MTATGGIQPFGGSSVPTGYLACDGSAVSRTTYADLFAVIGTTYGAGDGSTTFNLPDMQGKMSCGVGVNSLAAQIGNATHSHGGLNSHTLTTSELPNHNHPTGPFDTGDTSGFFTGENHPAASRKNTTNTGGGGSHSHSIPSQNNRPPYIVCRFIIKT